MRRERAIIITSHVDLHGERCDPDSLEPVAAEMNRKYLPLNVEHDLRKPLIGRIAASEVIRLEDGERAVESIIEIFEDGDSADLSIGDGRSIEVPKSDVRTFRVEYDRSYDTEDGQRLISSSASAFSRLRGRSGRKEGSRTDFESHNSCRSVYCRDHCEVILYKTRRRFVQRVENNSRQSL
jgi:hypothetical protein